MSARKSVEQKAAKATKNGITPQTEDEVVEMIRERGRVGRKKYRQTIDRVDLPPAAWARHLQEELGDALQYARRVERLLRLLAGARIIIGALLSTVEFSPKDRAKSARRWIKLLKKEFAP